MQGKKFQKIKINMTSSTKLQIPITWTRKKNWILSRYMYLYEHDETEQIQYQWGTALKLKLSII